MKNLNGARGLGRGQTTVEAAVVITGLIFLTFSIMNLGFLLHTKMVATYAAFMAGRSFQVLGDQTGSELFQENGNKEGGESSEFLAEMKASKYPGFFRVAEDIFTCALPWMAAPQGDRLQALAQDEQEKTVDERCAAGKRKYETFNVGTPVFIPWDPSGSKSASLMDDSSGLEKVKEGFTEQGRDPLRYGVLRLAYRTPLIFPIMADSPTAKFHSGEVFVPVLLNPGLRIELKKDDGSRDGEEDFANSTFKQN